MFRSLLSARSRATYFAAPDLTTGTFPSSKTRPLGSETESLQFRAEFFNAFNHTQFSNPDNQGYSGTFGQVTLTRVDARIIQFGLKLYF